MFLLQLWTVVSATATNTSTAAAVRISWSDSGLHNPFPRFSVNHINIYSSWYWYHFPSDVFDNDVVVVVFSSAVVTAVALLGGAKAQEKELDRAGLEKNWLRKKEHSEGSLSVSAIIEQKKVQIWKICEKTSTGSS